MLIDSHCHLDFAAFDNDRDFILARCRELNIERIVLPGVAAEQWPKVVELVNAEEQLLFAVGIHPWWIEANWTDKDVTGELAKLEEYLVHDDCIAVGECGLDANIDRAMAMQQQVLEQQLILAERFDKPVILHSVKSHNPLLQSLKRFPNARGVVHAFTGSYEQGMDFWNRGFYLGIGGVITYERAAKTRDAVARLPAEALLLETDAPDMPLAGKQGERNSPLFLPDILQALAELRDDSPEVLARITRENFRHLFQV
ncbi:TatD family hydrolase [Teredinibacter turnerae]|uniref:TatD family hydrolase n=1 Tax=Teredinibacter turnerae TaxID=2426 RepID=UPI0005F83C54|nr:TatD family hydrolase [Teredinibacter turnerae]